MQKFKIYVLFFLCMTIVFSVFTACADKTPSGNEEPPQTNEDELNRNVPFYPTKEFSDEREYCGDMTADDKLYKIYKYKEHGYRIIDPFLDTKYKIDNEQELTLITQVASTYQSETYYSFAKALRLSVSKETIDIVRIYLGIVDAKTEEYNTSPSGTGYTLMADAPIGIYSHAIVYEYNRYYVEIYQNDKPIEIQEVPIPIAAYNACLYRENSQSPFVIF